MKSAQKLLFRVGVPPSGVTLPTGITGLNFRRTDKHDAGESSDGQLAF